MEKFDLIVIGAGPGGYEAAAEAAAEYKMKVALVESRALGGTCLNRGCIPTKTLLHSADLLHELKEHGETLGLTNVGGEGYDMARLHARKNEVVDQLVSGIAGLMKKNKVKVYSGLGTIVDKGRVDVALNDGGTEELEADNILIATGSVPAVPPIPGSDNKKVLTSDELLDLDHPIKSLIVIGGGVIGCEFASVFSSLGVEVTVIEALPRIIANLDKEISRSLTMILKKSRGIDIHTDAMVTEIKDAGDQVTCCYKEKDNICEATADLVLMSIGRRANTAGLFSDASAAEISGMEMDRGMIIVNENYETSVPGIYAIGDVIGGIQLAHVATAEGRCAIAHMNDAQVPCDIKTIPSCIYTDPEIASVGISADEAKETGIPVISKKYSMGANGKSLLSLQERGFIKVIADKESHRILGAQMMCARATDMISQFSQAIVCGMTLEDMAKTIYPHPTFSEGIGEALK
jgi:dihydrolipoamide dehydrogenase